VAQPVFKTGTPA